MRMSIRFSPLNCKLIARRCLVFFACLLGISLAASAADKSEVSGALTLNGKDVELRHVYVWAEEEGFYKPEDPTWKILFVGREVSPRDLGDPIWDSAWVEIGITKSSETSDGPELQIYSQSIKKSADDPGNLSGGTYPMFEIEGLGTDLVTGRIYHEEPQEFFDDTYQYDFTFTASLSDPNAITGKPLPPDGGEPGLAYLKWVEVIRSGDVDALKKIVPPDLVEQIESASAEELKEQLGFLQATTPDKVKILSGSIDGDLAILQIEATVDNQSGNAEVELTRKDGIWMPTKLSM